MVASGGGSKMARISPARTTMSHTMKSASGPMKGSRRPHGNLPGATGAALALPDQGAAAAGTEVSDMTHSPFINPWLSP